MTTNGLSTLVVLQRAPALADAARSGFAPIRAPGLQMVEARLPVGGGPSRVRFRMEPDHRALLLATIMPIPFGRRSPVVRPATLALPGEPGQTRSDGLRLVGCFLGVVWNHEAPRLVGQTRSVGEQARTTRIALEPR